MSRCMDHNQNPDHIAPDLIDDAIAPVRGEFACTSDHARWPSIPEHGKGAGLVLPLCNTETMTLHLAEIGLAVASGAHAVVLLEQAGWHMTGKLNVPGNISIDVTPLTRLTSSLAAATSA